MNPKEFDTLRQRAVELFDSQPKTPASHRLSLDAIFQALASGADEPSAREPRRPAPAWFVKQMDLMRDRGEPFTVNQILILANKFPATRADKTQAGMWLREAGAVSRKSNGQIVFEFLK